MGRVGYINFWTQIFLSSVSGILMSFSFYISPEESKIITIPSILGIIIGLIGSFWADFYTRLAKHIQAYLKFKEGKGAVVKIITKKDVKSFVNYGVRISIFGLAITLIGLQSVSGLLVGKTLLNSSFHSLQLIGNMSGVYYKTLEILLLQAIVNMIVSHFVSLIFNL